MKTIIFSLSLLFAPGLSQANEVRCAADCGFEYFYAPCHFLGCDGNQHNTYPLLGIGKSKKSAYRSIIKSCQEAGQQYNRIHRTSYRFELFSKVDGNYQALDLSEKSMDAICLVLYGDSGKQ